MVKLTKIYTRMGDGGRTRLGDMSEALKHDPRVEAYGAVDEANSAIGLARAALSGSQLDAPLQAIQNDLFDVGGDLCVPEKEDLGFEPLRIVDSQVERLEREIDAHNAHLAPLDSFVLPAGSEAAARLHMARAITRRAERRVTALMETGAKVNEAALRYLNRLSDLLFVMARIANLDAGGDVKWVPGGER